MYTSLQITRQGYIDALAQSHMAIIDEPAERLALPLLSFKTENEVAKVINVTAQRASPRNKPVLAVVRGTGGGKTRALRELRFGLLRKCLRWRTHTTPPWGSLLMTARGLSDPLSAKRSRPWCATPSRSSPDWRA
eukprot:3616210-Rhodomonas_salina.1